MNLVSHNKGMKFPAEPLTKDEVLALIPRRAEAA